MIADHHLENIKIELGLKEDQIKAVTQLFDEGATVPFISRYRKEATGSLDEVAVTAIRDLLSQLVELDKRRDFILNSLEKNNHLSVELKKQVEAAQTLTELEDLYLPYKPKRRTRAMIAREKGLEPLAIMIFEQKGVDPLEQSLAFIDPDKNVNNSEEALAGARDIIAEIINEDQTVRSGLRQLYIGEGVFKSQIAKDMEETGIKYKDYFDWQEPARTAPSHRILAMRRGEKEDVLNLSIAPPRDKALMILEDLIIKGDGQDAAMVKIAIDDCYKRLLSRSMETEMRLLTKERADDEAIQVFSANMRQLLLSPPLSAKRILAIDPGFKSGCKVVCLDRQGKLLTNETIYPHSGKNRAVAAAKTLENLIKQFKIEAIAIGNGTAGRETEFFLKHLKIDSKIPILLVNESGASIYSASKVARDEFPDHDLTVRGSVSIGRRLMDPLAELVKIDPKSIGVGQYQHDVDQTRLKSALDDTVMSCVNKVGVEVNQASVQLLTYVSGLGPRLAKKIISFRNENGAFSCRADLKKVPRLGPKAFEQAAGFLRIKNKNNPLDASAVHPESYPIVHAMANDLKCTVVDLLNQPDLLKQIEATNYITDTVGLPTLKDILEELARPGRDPRQEFEYFSFAEEVESIKDLEVGMKLPGIITNITAFGAFVDIGVHQDGLVHISQLADRFVKNPADIIKVQQKVMVTVLSVDEPRKRISLSMKTEPAKTQKKNNKTRQSGKKPAKKVLNQFNSSFAEALQGFKPSAK